MNNIIQPQIQAVLFDLDGTLLDTAPDLHLAINHLRTEYGLPHISPEAMRKLINLGSKALVQLGFNVAEGTNEFGLLKQKFFTTYETHIADNTQFFPNIEKVLNHLEQEKIPWGIVTNKLTHHVHALLKKLEIYHRPSCIICGDTLKEFKPSPAPILHACDLIKKKPENCLYIGDAATDVTASKAAGTKSLVALYGYINHDDENPYDWQADGYIKDPLEIMKWL